MATTEQQMALALTPKFTGSLGIFGGTMLAYFICLDHVSHKANPILRALLTAACYEVMDAIAWFLSTWAVPRYTQWVWASGTQATCSFQGFFLHLSIGSPLSACTMAYYYYLVVLHGKTLQELAKLERFLLPCIVVYTVMSASVLLFKDQYNHIGAVCYAQGVPPLCGNSVFTPNPDVPCERGDWAWLYGTGLFYIPLWFCYLCIFYFNWCICWRMRSTPEGSWYASQSILYGLAFFITWTPSTLWSIMQWKKDANFWLDMSSAFFEPMAGFFNFVIFLRNRPKTCQELKRILCCCGNWEKEDGDDEHDPPPNERSNPSGSELGNATIPQTTPGELKLVDVDNMTLASQRSGISAVPASEEWIEEYEGRREHHNFHHHKHFHGTHAIMAESGKNNNHLHLKNDGHQQAPPECALQQPRSIVIVYASPATIPMEAAPVVATSHEPGISFDRIPSNFHLQMDPIERPRRAHYHQRHKTKDQLCDSQGETTSGNLNSTTTTTTTSTASDTTKASNACLQ